MRLFLFILLAIPLTSRALDVYVSPTGSDTAVGTANQPFATLNRARDEIRKQKPAGATVHLHRGFYWLSNPFTLTPQDSGTPTAPIIYEAIPGEMPILSGGELIHGFKADDKGRWIVSLPQVRDGKWDFAQLFVNGSRRFRPRMPKNGFYTIAGELTPTPNAKGRGYDRFTFHPGEFHSKSKNLGDVEALTFSNWFVSRMRVSEIDEQTHAVTFTGATGSLKDYGRFKPGWRYIIENTAESLTEPGEFYLDRHDGTLTYIPLPGEKIEKALIVAPRLEKLLVLQGDENQTVHDLTFRGISFQYANWVTPPSGHNDLQAEVSVRGAIYAVAAQHCTWDHCRIEHVGGYGIDLGSYCRENRIEECVLNDLGAGGIRIGEPGKSLKSETRAAGNRVTNNLISHGGRTLPGGVGIFILQSADNVVQHNEIADFYYTGISSGWTWGYRPSLSTGNQYLDNYVHQIGQGLLSDMGGIYTLGNHAGSVIRGNRFDDIWCHEYGGWGIYFDEGTSGVLAENNWVTNTRTGGLHQHYGKDNVVRNNVFANGVQQWLERTRVEPDHISFTFEKNIVVGDSPNVFKGDWQHQLVVDHNVYWRPNGPANFRGHPFNVWQKDSGQDAHSFFADPGLADIDHGDFHVKPGSPAEKIGFQFFDPRNAGLTGDMKSIPHPQAPPGFPTTKRPYQSTP